MFHSEEGIRMNEIIISNIVNKNNVNFRIFHAREHKIILSAMNYEKIASKEITINVVVNRTIEELEDFFMMYTPTEEDTIYNNKTYENEPDVIIYSNLTSKTKELAEEFFKITTDEAYDLLKDLLASLSAVINDPLGSLDKLHDKEWGILKSLESSIEEDDKTELLNILTTHLDKRKKVGYCQKTLGSYLSKSGVVLRKNVGTPYILDKTNNVYMSLEFDDIMTKLNDEIGKNLVCNDDLEKGLTFLDTRLEPEANKVRFKNCIYDMVKHETVTLEDPILTLVELDYNYNPNAKSTYLKQFLETSLAKKTKEETDNSIKGLKQLVGYCFVSGNPRNALPIITGIAGGGKSIVADILTNMFGKNNICNISLQDLTSGYAHNTEGMVEKHLNIIFDSDDSEIMQNGIIKQITGNDAVKINPKGTKSFLLPKEQVPKTIMICNMPPAFKRLEDAILERLVIIEFEIKFRGTSRQDPELADKILKDTEEIEWFIYECLEEYKLMCQNKEDFLLRTDKTQTNRTLNKHTHPLEYLLNKLVYTIYSDEWNTLEDLENMGLHASKQTKIYQPDIHSILLMLSEEEGLELPTNKDHKLTQQKITKTIKEVFIDDEGDLKGFCTISDGKKGRYYKINNPDDTVELCFKPTLLYDEYLQKIRLAEAKKIQAKNKTSEAKELLESIITLSEDNTDLKATDEFKEAKELLDKI